MLKAPEIILVVTLAVLIYLFPKMSAIGDGLGRTLEMFFNLFRKKPKKQTEKDAEQDRAG